VTFEIEIPDEWPPGLGFAVVRLIQQSLKEGFPLVVPVQRNITPDQLEAAFDSIKTVIQKAGLAA
jgi:hypothetical protein